MSFILLAKQLAHHLKEGGPPCWEGGQIAAFSWSPLEAAKALTYLSLCEITFPSSTIQLYEIEQIKLDENLTDVFNITMTT